MSVMLNPESHLVTGPWPLQGQAEGEVCLVEDVGVPWGHVVTCGAVRAVPALKERDRFWDTCCQGRADAARAHGLAAVVLGGHADQSQRVEDRVGHLLPRDRLRGHSPVNHPLEKGHTSTVTAYGTGRSPLGAVCRNCEAQMIGIGTKPVRGCRPRSRIEPLPCCVLPRSCRSTSRCSILDLSGAA
jgi:hypothetical protein